MWGYSENKASKITHIIVLTIEDKPDSWNNKNHLNENIKKCGLMSEQLKCKFLSRVYTKRWRNFLFSTLLSAFAANHLFLKTVVFCVTILLKSFQSLYDYCMRSINLLSWLKASACMILPKKRRPRRFWLRPSFNTRLKYSGSDFCMIWKDITLWTQVWRQHKQLFDNE